MEPSRWRYGTFSIEINAASEYVKPTACAVANGTALYQRVFLRTRFSERLMFA
jgi:hypothetical protein